jgi:hypothetical protein
VLILIVLLNILYPITINGSIISLIFFAALYAGLFIVGIFITSDSRIHITWSTSIAVLWLVMAVIYAFVDNTLHTPVHWQQFVYYSLVTLSTAGYDAQRRS